MEDGGRGVSRTCSFAWFRVEGTDAEEASTGGEDVLLCEGTKGGTGCREG